MPRRKRARAIDQEIDTAEPGDGFCDDGIEAGKIGEIVLRGPALDHPGSDPGREPLRPARRILVRSNRRCRLRFRSPARGGRPG